MRFGLRVALAAVCFGVLAGASVYAYEEYRRQQAFEALLNDCSQCVSVRLAGCFCIELVRSAVSADRRVLHQA